MKYPSMLAAMAAVLCTVEIGALSSPVADDPKCEGCLVEFGVTPLGLPLKPLETITLTLLVNQPGVCKFDAAGDCKDDEDCTGILQIHYQPAPVDSGTLSNGSFGEITGGPGQALTLLSGVYECEDIDLTTVWRNALIIETTYIDCTECEVVH